MNGPFRQKLAIVGMLVLVVFAQAGAVCHVVNCSLPEPPQCPHHQPEPETVMAGCDSLAAIPSSDEMAWAVEVGSGPLPVVDLISGLSSQPAVSPVSRGSSPPVLRI